MNAHENENYPFFLPPNLFPASLFFEMKTFFFLRLDLVVVFSFFKQDDSRENGFIRTLIFVKELKMNKKAEHIRFLHTFSIYKLDCM